MEEVPRHEWRTIHGGELGKIYLDALALERRLDEVGLEGTAETVGFVTDDIGQAIGSFHTDTE